jgi:putative membrane protein
LSAVGSETYLWLKAAHVIAVIAWMAGQLYLPRLFVYHASAQPGSEFSERLKVMERRLYRTIMTPAMIAAVALGAALLALPGVIDWAHDFWIYPKLVLVLGLSGFHGLLGRWRRAFAADRNRHSERFFRLLNEAPTLALIAIVIFVIIKPF